jgi:galactose oxidase-like protein
MQVPRLYHSTALLLPDGRVLVAGGGRFGVDQLSAEIYSPPYLFKGAPPAITAVTPTNIQYGTTFSVQTPDASRIDSVSLIRLGSVTHAFNMDQRFLELAFSQQSGSLNVQAPNSANLAPPGYYMLFIVDTSGVPSVASIVRIS